jgi:NADH-quinone oxidoreductase subunit C
MLNRLVELINQNISEANAQLQSPAEGEAGDSSILIEASSIYKVAEFLRDNQELSFNALQVISGVDYTEYIEVCYIFCNFDMAAPRDAIIKLRVTDRIAPAVDSIVSVYAAANYQERECYDMLGVTFNNHPDPRRILCPYDWEGFPLRRDYLAAKYYNGMEVYPDHKMNMEDREFIVRQKEILKAQKAAAKAAEAEKTE